MDKYRREESEKERVEDGEVQEKRKRYKDRVRERERIGNFRNEERREESEEMRGKVKRESLK